MRRSPDHVHGPCAGTRSRHPPVPAPPRRLFGHRPREGAAPPNPATGLQRSSCSSIPGSQAGRVQHRRASGTTITITPSPGAPVAMCRFPALRDGLRRPYRRPGTGRHASRDRRQHRRRRAPGGRAHAGAPAERPAPGTRDSPGVPGDRRRALHDVIAGTAVICSRDARAARRRFLSGGRSRRRVRPVPVLHPAWSGGCSGIAPASSTGIRVPSGLTASTGTLTSRTPLSYRAVTSAGSTLAGSLTSRASDP